ncbi:hypothetical protein VC83_09001 [Pseudogymnoascus destructans]|uniref:Chromo domain-containing protein n=1 Tax=Pseudogymnoascus destructans TaxID=655981 RepID=A0A176ZX14_9PEZI|nr:uncharacterized protein VC83_09001 [Pseudogymnoascus destructans]OAF54489.1 hypothetical protein VC83_09001 [Pseudogymnoascus destructans]
MTSIQWDSQQFYQPPRPVAIPPSTFWPPSHSQAGAGSTYFQPPIASARFEEVKGTTTHGAPQNTSSSYKAELPPDQGQSLHGIKEITQDQDSRDAAVVSNAETEILSIGKPLLLAANRDVANVVENLDSVYGPATDSNQVKWGTSQDKPILLDSDVGSNGEFDNVENGTPLDLTMRDAILSHSHPTFDTAYIPRSTYNIGVAEPTGDEGLRQVEASSILSQNDTTIATEMNGDLLLASQNIESPIGLASVQETSAISVTEGIPTNEGKIDKYQPKSRRDNNDHISAENDHMDKIELSLGMTRSDDRDGSIDGTDGEDHANDSSGSDIEPRQHLKRRRAKSTDSSAQTNFRNVKDVTFPTDIWDVLSQGGTAVSFDLPLKSQSINGGDHVNDSDTAGSEIQERRLKRPRRAKSTESSAHMSPSNVKEASFAMANSSEVSTPKTGATSSDSPLESHEIPIGGSLTLQTFQSGIVYCLKFSQKELPFPLDIEQAQDVISSASSGDRDRERPHLRERVVRRLGRHSTYSENDDQLLIQLKEKDKLPWDEIAEYFPERTKGTLQVHYCTKLKNRSQTSKYKKRKITNSANESGGTYPSVFSMELLDPQLRDALPSTPFVAATADSTKGAHRSILSTGNKEHTAVQPRCSSQGAESDTDEICEVEALLAKSTTRNVVWYLVKWEGFGDDKNTWQEQDDISSDLVGDFEASYQGNFGVELLKKRERRGKTEYFVKWKGRPEIENSWEKEDTIHCERILEFEAR